MQAYLRNGKNNRNGTAAEASSHMLSHFARTVFRAPVGAVPGTKFLYRGVDDYEALHLEHDGVYVAKGFSSFSRDESIARDFPRALFLVRLAVKDVAAGTPWVWVCQRLRSGPNDVWATLRAQGNTELNRGLGSENVRRVSF